MLLASCSFTTQGFAGESFKAGSLIPGTSARESSFKIDELASGLGVPWGMVELSGNRLLFTERAGRVAMLELSSGKVEYLEGIPAVAAQGQGGLMDVTATTDTNGIEWLYFTYSKPLEGGAATALARARLEGGQVLQWQDIFVSNLVSTAGRHFGSRLCFDKAGHLFMSHGDRGDRPSAQNRSNHGGAILRLNLDGSVPRDNPFVDNVEWRNEIWSYGHRNPQGIVCDNDNNRVWAIEHGPRGGDEINLVEKGRNYGWPVISYGKEYVLPIMVGEGTHKKGMEQPMKVYVPSIAPSSLLLYKGDLFPQWQGSLLAGALAQTHINIISLNDDGTALGEQRILEDLGERIRGLVEGQQGEIYFSTDSGKIFRLTPGAE